MGQTQIRPQGPREPATLAVNIVNKFNRLDTHFRQEWIGDGVAVPKCNRGPILTSVSSVLCHWLQELSAEVKPALTEPPFIRGLKTESRTVAVLPERPVGRRRADSATIQPDRNAQQKLPSAHGMECAQQ